MSEPSGNDRALDVDTRPVEDGVPSGAGDRPTSDAAPAHDALPAAGHAGGVLARARQSHHMSVEQVAHRIKVGAKQVEAIEAGRWADFPTPAILRGFVRAYAKAVDIDAAPLLAELPRIEVTPGQLTGVASVGRPVSAGGRNFSGFGWWLGAGLGAVVLVAAAVLLPKLDLAGWMAAHESAPSAVQPGTTGADSSAPASPAAATPIAPSASAGAPGAEGAPSAQASAPVGQQLAAQQPAVQQPVAQQPAVQQPAAQQPAAQQPAPGQLAAPVPLLPTQQAGGVQAGNPPAAPGAVSPGAPVAANPATPAAAAAGVPTAPGPATPAAAPAPVTATAPAPGNSRLKLDFERETWIEIRDASGKIISTGVTPAGGSVTSEGKPPFRIIIGNVPGTRFAVDGRAVELAPFSSGNVARFTYPPENKQ